MFEPPGYDTLNVLREGKIIDLDGGLFKVKGHGEVSVGDIYIGKEVREVNGWITPVGNGYPFDIRECVAVEMVEGVEAMYKVPAYCLHRVVAG
jgi:hypothetical protein